MKYTKRVLLFALCLLLIAPAMQVQAFDKKKKAEDKKETPADDNEIHWLSIDDVQVAMKKQPKKVYMDVYTDWCGWCKVMDKKTFTNKNVIKYINENFYAVKLNAEQKDSIRFMGKMYGFLSDYRANEFAVNLLRGQMSFPTSVVLEENFQNPQPIPGYMDVSTMEMVLKYINEGHAKDTPFDKWQKEFKASWE